MSIISTIPVTPNIIPAIPSLLAFDPAKESGTPPCVLTLNCGAKLTLCSGKKAGGADSSDSRGHDGEGDEGFGEAENRSEASRSLDRNSANGVGPGNVKGPSWRVLDRLAA